MRNDSREQILILTHFKMNGFVLFLNKDNTYWSHLSMNITTGRAHANNSVTQKYL